MRYHAPPMPCAHDSAAPCFDCGQPRGYRFTADDGAAYMPAWRCWRCAWAPVRPIMLARIAARDFAPMIMPPDGSC
jgi:hypothetical protein